MTQDFDPREIIPFYGGQRPDMFEIERRCMDRDGKVIAHLDGLLPGGLVLDIGAGNGFTASALSNAQRTVIPMEPDPNMIDRSKGLLWARGTAQSIPFHDHAFSAAYSTWAFFLPGVAERPQGLAEVIRVTQPGGLIVIVDNAGDDGLCALSPRTIAEPDGRWYTERGFERTIIETSYRFDSVPEAQALMAFYFGKDIGLSVKSDEISYRVAVYTGHSNKLTPNP